MASKTDELDANILLELQKDGRESYRKMGKKLKVPHTTVFTRAEAMLKHKLFRFSIQFMPEDLGLQEVIFTLKGQPSKIKDLAQAVGKLPEISKIQQATLEASLYVTAVMSNEVTAVEDMNIRLYHIALKVDESCIITVTPVKTLKVGESVPPEVLREAITKGLVKGKC
jgi:DNA-binding Lrp family transcriptional regulator